MHQKNQLLMLNIQTADEKIRYERKRQSRRQKAKRTSINIWISLNTCHQFAAEFIHYFPTTVFRW